MCFGRRAGGESPYPQPLLVKRFIAIRLHARRFADGMEVFGPPYALACQIRLVKNCYE
jgi:hypothetical protein